MTSVGEEPAGSPESAGEFRSPASSASLSFSLPGALRFADVPGGERALAFEPAVGEPSVSDPESVGLPFSVAEVQSSQLGSFEPFESLSEEGTVLAVLLASLGAALDRHRKPIEAFVAALAADGRAFAQTEAGARARDALSRSPQLARLRLTWDALNLSAAHASELAGAGDGERPSIALQVLEEAIGRGDLERILAAALEARARPGGQVAG